MGPGCPLWIPTSSLFRLNGSWHPPPAWLRKRNLRRSWQIPFQPLGHTHAGNLLWNVCHTNVNNFGMVILDCFNCCFQTVYIVSCWYRCWSALGHWRRTRRGKDKARGFQKNICQVQSCAQSCACSFETWPKSTEGSAIAQSWTNEAGEGETAGERYFKSNWRTSQGLVVGRIMGNQLNETL